MYQRGPDIGNFYLCANHSWLPSWIQPYLPSTIELRPPGHSPLPTWEPPAQVPILWNCSNLFTWGWPQPQWPYLVYMDLFKLVHLDTQAQLPTSTQNLFRYVHCIVHTSIGKCVINLWKKDLLVDSPKWPHETCLNLLTWNPTQPQFTYPHGDITTLAPISWACSNFFTWETPFGPTSLRPVQTY